MKTWIWFSGSETNLANWILLFFFSDQMGLLYRLLLLFFSLGVATFLLLVLLFLLLLLLLFFSLCCYYSSPIIIFVSLLFYSSSYYHCSFPHCSDSFRVVVTLLTWCCSFPLISSWIINQVVKTCCYIWEPPYLKIVRTAQHWSILGSTIFVQVRLLCI
jgi:hypothetical protein